MNGDILHGYMYIYICVYIYYNIEYGSVYIYIGIYERWMGMGRSCEIYDSEIRICLFVFLKAPFIFHGISSEIQ